MLFRLLSMTIHPSIDFFVIAGTPLTKRRKVLFQVAKDISPDLSFIEKHAVSCKKTSRLL